MKYSKLTRGMTLGFFILLMLWSANVLPCACCADPGSYYINSYELPSYEKNELKSLKFTGYFEEVHGEADAEWTWDRYFVSGKFDGKRTFRFYTIGEGEESSPVGFIYFKAKTKAELFKADFPGTKSGLGVQLYKELRFSGKVFFREKISSLFGNKTVPAFLVIQGKGNHCFTGDDFNHFMLFFSLPKKGKKVPFHMWGDVR